MNTNTERAHAAYRHGQVAASSPLRIVVLLYDAAIRFTRQGYERYDQPSMRGEALGRAHAIVSELLLSLDHEQGGEIALRLESLYRFVLDAFVSANAAGKRAALPPAIEVLETLASSWREIERTWRPDPESK